jgi:hypothetical protein
MSLVEEVLPGSARLVRIMAKLATNRVSTVKLPNGQQTEAGKETLKETVTFLIQS